MAQTVTVTIIQEVEVPHNETIVREWYDRIVRTITRELDANGGIVSEEVVSEEELETRCEEREETIATDEDTEDEEVISEEIEDED
jgi:hypothetical protein